MINDMCNCEWFGSLAKAAQSQQNDVNYSCCSQQDSKHHIKKKYMTVFSVIEIRWWLVWRFG